MIMERNFQPVIIFSFSKKECEAYALQMSKLDFNSGENSSNCNFRQLYIMQSAFSTPQNTPIRIMLRYYKQFALVSRITLKEYNEHKIIMPSTLYKSATLLDSLVFMPTLIHWLTIYPLDSVILFYEQLVPEHVVRTALMGQ